MRVLAWSASGRIGPYVTGVGKHIIHMTRGLARRDGWDVCLMMSADAWRRDQKGPTGSPLADIPAVRLPMDRWVAEALWRTTEWPSVDRWAGDADWVYCPKELYVPVRYARYAVTVHDVYHLEPLCRDSNHRYRLRWRAMLRRGLEEATVVLTVSEVTKGRVVELLGISPGKIRVVGNGVEEGFFEVFNKDPRAVSPFGEAEYVVAVGGLTRKKGGKDLLRFAEALERTAPGVDLVITGPVEKPFESAVKKARNIRVMRRGFPNAQMQMLVRGAIASVTLSQYEGFGIPVLEAMAAGVPVIAARRAALPEVVGDAGILVDPMHSEEIARTVADLRHDRPFRECLIEKGRCRAAQFTWDACVDRLCSAFEEFGSARRA